MAGLLSGPIGAVTGPPWLLPPDPALARMVRAEVLKRLDALFEERIPRWNRVKPRKLLRTARGRRVPRGLVPA